jgi:hypothetical protein
MESIDNQLSGIIWQQSRQQLAPAIAGQKVGLQLGTQRSWRRCSVPAPPAAHSLQSAPAAATAGAGAQSAARLHFRPAVEAVGDLVHQLPILSFRAKVTTAALDQLLLQP